MELTKDISRFSELLPITAYPSYLSIYGFDYGYLIEHDLILPFFIEKRSFFKRMIFSTNVLGDSSYSHTEFLNNTVKFIRKYVDIDFISVPHTTALFDAIPENSMFCRFGSYIVNLKLSEDELFSNIHPKHRNVIKKAQKDGVSILNGDAYIDDCVDLIIHTLKRQNMLVPQKAIYYEFLNKLGKNVDFWVAKHNNEIQGSAVIIWNNQHSAFYLSGGSIINPYIGSMNLLHWEAMKLMKNRGVCEYNFVGARVEPEAGSRLEGIQRFKSRFGGEMRTGYLWKMPINQFKYKLYYFMAHAAAFSLNIKYKGDAIDQEIKRNRR